MLEITENNGLFRILEQTKKKQPLLYEYDFVFQFNFIHYLFSIYVLILNHRKLNGRYKNDNFFLRFKLKTRLEIINILLIMCEYRLGCTLIKRQVRE